MSSVQASAADQQLALQTAAQKYGIPVGILKGVYATETTSGKDIHTSTAGAQGAFQFLPGTAAKYNYPLTNNVDASTFTEQAFAAAHYLSDLLHGNHGDWAAALNQYSGGGGAAYVKKVQAGAGAPLSSGTDLGGPIGAPLAGAASAAGDAASAIGDVGSAVGSIATLVTSTQFWIRLVEGIAGLLLLYLGLHALTGNSNNVGDQVKHVRTFVPLPI